MSLLNCCYRCTKTEIPTNLLVKELVFNYLGDIDADTYLTDTIIKMARDASDRANYAADVVDNLVVGKVRAQDVSTVDGSTQDVKNNEFFQNQEELFQNQAAFPFEGSYINVGSFELGATITQRNQALSYEADGKLYRWAGDLPKLVPANSTPTSSGGIGYNTWLEVSDVNLRQELTNPAKGAAMVARGVVAVDTIADLLALSAEQLKENLRYSTAGYHSKGDGGGALYFISSTDPGYGIPLPDGRFAVFCDTFDIRKFGIISSATLRQDDNLLRMRAYADAFVYEIDFLNFSIVTPDSNAGVSGRESVANGLWFENAHHIKNLHITNDKSERLETGKCCLIFCPTSNPTSTQEVVYENISIDAWNDNYQPVTDNYLGAYDGMRHGIFIHPKVNRKVLSDGYEDVYKASNFIFKFKNIKFLSGAYSYNITQAGVRSRSVVIDGLSGDAFLQINLDTVNLYAKDVHTNLRRDKLEKGRLMVMNAIHFEPEHGGRNGYIHEMVLLENCTSHRTLVGGEAEAGQLLWITALSEDPGSSVYDKIVINNCYGTATVQSNRARYGNIHIKNCIDGFRFDCNNTNIEKVLIENSVLVRLHSNTGYVPHFSRTSIQELKYKNVHFPAVPYDYRTLPDDQRIGNLILDNISIGEEVSSSKALFMNSSADNITLKNSELPTVRSGLFRHLFDTKILTIENCIIGDDSLNTNSIANIRYTDSSLSTIVYLRNNTFRNGTNPTLLYFAGSLEANGNKSTRFIRARLPIDAGNPPYTPGINTLTASHDMVMCDADLVSSYDLSKYTVQANSSKVLNYPVMDETKDVSVKMSEYKGIDVTNYIAGGKVYISLRNTTETVVELSGVNITVRQLV